MATASLGMCTPTPARSMGEEILLLIRHDEMDESAKGHAGGAFCEPRLGVVVPGGAGDIQVNPGRVAGEFLDEHGARDCASPFATADVLDFAQGPFYAVA